MKETHLIIKMNEMCTESLSPDLFEKWEDVKKALESVRKNLRHIDWEFIEWSEKKESIAWVDGVDSDGREYTGTAQMHGMEIIEVEEIEPKTS